MPNPQQLLSDTSNETLKTSTHGDVPMPEPFAPQALSPTKVKFEKVHCYKTLPSPLSARAAAKNAIRTAKARINLFIDLPPESNRTRRNILLNVWVSQSFISRRTRTLAQGGWRIYPRGRVANPSARHRTSLKLD